MPIDSREEQCYTLSAIRQFLPETSRGNKPHQSVVYRWVTRGLKARDGSVVKLECLICGGAICTSREAIERFFAELTARSGLAPMAPKQDRSKQRTETSLKLQELGLKA